MPLTVEEQMLAHLLLETYSATVSLGFLLLNNTNGDIRMSFFFGIRKTVHLDKLNRIWIPAQQTEEV